MNKSMSFITQNGITYYPQEYVKELEEELRIKKELCSALGEDKLNLKAQNTELRKENAELKILVSSMLYEINALWDISEMNEDVRKHAEKIDSEM